MPPVEIDLSRMPGVFSTQPFLPRCNWELAARWLAEHIPAEAHRDAWTSVQRQWLWRMQRALDIPYHIHESDRVLLLSGMDRSATSETTGVCERVLDTIEQYLPGVAMNDRVGKHVILCFDHPIRLRLYMTGYPEIPEWARGVCIGGRMVHVAIESDSDGFDNTLCHELTHACLAHRDIPRWLNEGMAQRMATILTSRTAVSRYQTFPSEGKQFWRNQGVEVFLAGEAFQGDREAARWSYILSDFLLERICQSAGDGLRSFLLNAQACDGGRASAQQHLGRSLESIIHELVSAREQPNEVNKLQPRFFGVGKWW